MQTIHLKQGKHKRVKSGHQWIFAGEIAENVKTVSPGEKVTVCDARGRLLGRGYLNPHSLIAVRLMTDPKDEWTDDLVYNRIVEAKSFRDKTCENWQAYRLIYSEGDSLPGLIVDNYAGHLVVQSLTAGMELLLGDVIETLRTVLKPDSIFLKCDSPFRKLEGLEERIESVYGDTPSEVQIDEEYKYLAHPVDGQKSGYYLDQRLNRQLIKNLSQGKDILDLFSYTGAWATHALLSGAESAVVVESSANAIERGKKGFSLNNLSNRTTFINASVTDYLADCIENKVKFDVVILDPPALIRSRSALKQGMISYERLHQSVMKIIADDGIVVSCSCSHLLDREDHLKIIGKAAAMSGKRIRVIHNGGQPPDHPVRAGHPETEYLKCFVVHCV